MSSAETNVKRKRDDSAAAEPESGRHNACNSCFELERGIFRMHQLEVTCRSMERELLAEWSYSAPALLSNENDYKCLESNAVSIVDQKCNKLEARRSFLENTLTFCRDGGRYNTIYEHLPIPHREPFST